MHATRVNRKKLESRKDTKHKWHNTSCNARQDTAVKITQLSSTMRPCWSYCFSAPLHVEFLPLEGQPAVLGIWHELNVIASESV